MELNIKISTLAPMNPRSQSLGLPPKTIFLKTICNGDSDSKPGTLLTLKAPTMVPSKNIDTELQQIIGPSLSS